MIGHEGGVYPSNIIIPHLKSGQVCAGMSVRKQRLSNKNWPGLRQNHWQGLLRNGWQGLDRNRGRIYVGILKRQAQLFCNGYPRRIPKGQVCGGKTGTKRLGQDLFVSPEHNAEKYLGAQ